MNTVRVIRYPGSHLCLTQSVLDKYASVNCSSTRLNPCIFTIYLHRPVSLSRNIGRSGRFQWSLGLKRSSAAACVLGLWVRMPLGAWTSAISEYYVLSGRGICVGLITHPEESYRVCCV